MNEGGLADAMHKLIFLIALVALARPLAAAPGDARKPNVVLIYADDLGYADLGCYGSRIPTPNIDRLAVEGIRFSNFYAAQAVCSASRAALMTGCYPNRVGILGALGPKSTVGLSTNEITIAGLLRSQGYATAIYGKWHLGDAPEFLPRQHGFDDYFGLPYSNDMWPHHPTAGTNYPPLPLIDGDRVVALMPDQTQLTTRYTERSVQFIQNNRHRPFFLYLPQTMPHVPLHVSDKFRNRSGQGLYGDVIMEIDWSVGQVLQTLHDCGLDDQTLVIFSSDNGPWLLYGDHAGRARPLREGKATTFEGGQRVPCLVRWPGKIPAGQVRSEVATTMDILPTLADLAGGALPADRTIDGRNIWPLLAGQPAPASLAKPFFYFWERHLQAVRNGKWKLHFPHPYPQPDPAGSAGQPGQYSTRQIGLELYDLEADPGETTNLAAQFPEVVRTLQNLADVCRADLGDSAEKRSGENVRPVGRASNGTAH